MRGLYVIVDPEHCAGRDPRWVAEQALLGGCAALQLRSKQLADAARLSLARTLSTLCSEHGVPFWMNDRVDLGLLANATGVHLGQDDLSLADARSLFPAAQLGLSTHSLAQAQAAALDGADLIGFGPVFSTRSKQDAEPCVGIEGLREVVRQVAIPVIAIGGIELLHARQVAGTGAHYAAVISAVCMAKDPRDAARGLHEALLTG